MALITAIINNLEEDFMPPGIRKFSDTLSQGRLVLLFLVFFIIMVTLINGKPFGLTQMKEVTGGIGILDMEFNNSVEKAYGMLTNMGQAGRDFYWRILGLDFIFPLSCVLFLTSCTLFFVRKMPFLPLWLIIFPFLGFIFDYSENFMTIIMLSNFPAKLTLVTQIGSVFTKLKFIFLGLSYILVMLEIIIFLIIQLKKFFARKG